MQPFTGLGSGGLPYVRSLLERLDRKQQGGAHEMAASLTGRVGLPRPKDFHEASTVTGSPKARFRGESGPLMILHRQVLPKRHRPAPLEQTGPRRLTSLPRRETHRWPAERVRGHRNRFVLFIRHSDPGAVQRT